MAVRRSGAWNPGRPRRARGLVNRRPAKRACDGSGPHGSEAALSVRMSAIPDIQTRQFPTSARWPGSRHRGLMLASGRWVFPRGPWAAPRLASFRVCRTSGFILPPALAPCLPLAPHSHRCLVLALAVKRPHLVKQVEEARSGAEDFLAHLPEVPRRPLPRLRTGDRAPRIADLARQARLGKFSSFP